MGNLVQIKRPKAGEDFFALWKSINELIDAINDISVTIVPADYVTKAVTITEGDIQFDFDAAKINAALSSLAGGSNPPGGSPDNPGGTGDGPRPDPVFGTQHVDCRVGQQTQVFTAPISYVCYDVQDYALVYDNRANMNLLFTAGIGSLGNPGVGQVVVVFGIAFGREPSDTINMGNVCGGLGQPACPPAGCSPPPAPRLRCTLYACDYPANGGIYGPPGG
jgi:hypothetical protein